MSEQYKDPEQLRKEQGIDAPWEKKAKVEILKRDSKGLRGNVFQEMTDTSTPNVSEDSYNLMKHFGMYQQDDRDNRIERKRAGLDKDWSFMIRAKVPGGYATPEQYLMMDDLATNYSNGSLRLTTRQTIQFHGIGKLKLQNFIRDLHKTLLTSYGACGDVVRNTMSCPVVDIDGRPEYAGREAFIELAKRINERTLPKTNSYYDVFIDGELDTTGQPKFPEPIRDEKEDLYGETYMPRKFKIAVTTPEDNCVDIFSQDLGLLALRTNNVVRGYNILVGGGLGSSHSNKETYPRLAEAVAYIGTDDILRAVDAVIAIQRDYGNRTNRKRARLKYLLDEVGGEWFHQELSRRLSQELAPAEPIAPSQWGFDDHLGWHEQRQPGLYYCGIFIENGRIRDTAERKTRSNLRFIVEKFRCQVRLTPQQNILLANIAEKNVKEISAILEDSGLSTGNGWLSTLRRNEIACVALPTCGLALSEAERVMPSLMDNLEKLGWGDERIMIRMSGCPNSCSRPPMSEVGIIGRAMGKYNLYLGGDYEGTRLNQLFRENVLFDDLAPELDRLLKRWKAERMANEAFGDWCHRIGNEALKVT